VTSSFHPEELFDLERQASLSESQRAARDRHLASCATCRLEHGWRGDFAREALDGDDDGALLERALGGALSAVSQVPASKRRTRSAAASALGVGVLAAGFAAAALLRPAAVAPGPGPRPPVAAPPAPARLAAPPVARPQEMAPAREPSVPVARARPLSAAQLFGRANAARRAGDVDEAVRLYRRLLADHGASREARTSEVTMARLLLDTRGDAAEALRLFERYARAAPDGNLAEEALLGRAEALGRLGRGADEAAAWAALLQRFPGTVHRARAEARLREMSAPAR